MVNPRGAVGLFTSADEFTAIAAFINRNSRHLDSAVSILSDTTRNTDDFLLIIDDGVAAGKSHTDITNEVMAFYKGHNINASDDVREFVETSVRTRKSLAEIETASLRAGDDFGAEQANEILTRNGLNPNDDHLRFIGEYYRQPASTRPDPDVQRFASDVFERKAGNSANAPDRQSGFWGSSTKRWQTAAMVVTPTLLIWGITHANNQSGNWLGELLVDGTVKTITAAVSHLEGEEKRQRIAEMVDGVGKVKNFVFPQNMLTTMAQHEMIEQAVNSTNDPAEQERLAKRNAVLFHFRNPALIMGKNILKAAIIDQAFPDATSEEKNLMLAQYFVEDVIKGANSTALTQYGYRVTDEDVKQFIIDHADEINHIPGGERVRDGLRQLYGPELDDIIFVNGQDLPTSQEITEDLIAQSNNNQTPQTAPGTDTTTTFAGAAATIAAGADAATDAADEALAAGTDIIDDISIFFNPIQWLDHNIIEPLVGFIKDMLTAAWGQITSAFNAVSNLKDMLFAPDLRDQLENSEHVVGQNGTGQPAQVNFGPGASNDTDEPDEYEPVMQ